MERIVDLRKVLSYIKFYGAVLLPFLYMDVLVRLVSEKHMKFYPIYSVPPLLFTLLYVSLLAGLMLWLGRKGGSYLYWGFFLLSFAFFVVNLIYYNLTGLYFGFNLMEMAGEGSAYMWNIVKETPVLTWAKILGSVFFTVFGKRLINRCWIEKQEQKVIVAQSQEKSGKKRSGLRPLILLLFVFVGLHMLIPFTLGKTTKTLKWNSFSKGRNVYNTFSDSVRSMRVCGMYEYGFRSFYMTYLKAEEKMSEEDQSFLAEQISQTAVSEANDYTGLFAGKNVIFLQLEGIDDWLLTKEDMPNLYALKQESMDFTDHYAIYTGGGSTFNSEFAVNVGFTTPSSYVANVYTYNNHTYPQTMAKLFSEKDYSVNAFHMNTSGFYSRGANYHSWGYDAYNSLIELNTYEDESYDLDRELILNEEFYEKMFPASGQFVDYIITYTPHTPFTTEEGVGKMVAELEYGEGNAPELSEEEVVRLEVKETDYMVGLLIQALKDQGLYENTVIVAYADHYLYTINDKTVLDQYKITEDNRINHTPFFIWSVDGGYQAVKEVNMQYDILPTVLNLFGISYNPTYCLGTDILSKTPSDIAVFPDGSWYDGQVYVTDGQVTWADEKHPEEEEEVAAKSEWAAALLRKNDLVLRYDYFRQLEKDR